MKKYFWRILFWANLVVRLLLLLFFVLLLITQVVVEPPVVLNDISTQRVRCERIAKDVLILQYYWSNLDDRAQAVSEIQDSLPGWEHEQATLQKSKNDAVLLFMGQSSNDFTPMDVAAHTLLAQANQGPADVTQVAIILSHERSYTLSVSTLLTQLVGEVTTYDIQLFIAEMSAGFLILLLSAIEQIVKIRLAKRKLLQSVPKLE